MTQKALRKVLSSKLWESGRTWPRLGRYCGYEEGPKSERAPKLENYVGQIIFDFFGQLPFEHTAVPGSGTDHKGIIKGK